MSKRKKRKKKHLTGKAVLLCLFLVLLVYIGISFINNSGGSLTTYMAREGEISESFTVDGFIFKDQKVITAPQDGYLECAVSESGRIGKGGIVAYIYENDAPIKEKNRIREIDEKIKELTENDRSMSASENDSIRLEQDVLKQTIRIPELVRDNDIESLMEVRASLDNVVEARKKISGGGESNQQIIGKLQEEKNALLQKFDMAKTAIVTDIAGSFTARTDGLEEMLDDERIENISQSYLKSIKTPETKTNVEAKISSGAPIGKIVDTYTWYFAAVVSKDIADSLSIGGGIRLKFLDSSDNMIDGSVYKIADENDGKAVLVVKSAGYVDNLYSMSKVKVEVVKKTYEGMKIPAKSIRVKDGEKGVYILSGKKVKFRNAKVYYMNEDWAVVSREEKNGIKLYDSVVVNGSNIYEGKVVR